MEWIKELIATSAWLRRIGAPSPKFRFMGWPMLLGGIITVTTFSAGCAGIDTAEWTEQVQLHDGTMIIVSRKARAYSNGFPEPRGALIDQETFGVRVGMPF